MPEKVGYSLINIKGICCANLLAVAVYKGGLNALQTSERTKTCIWNEASNTQKVQFFHSINERENS